MQVFAQLGAHVFEVLFFAGLAGSVVVVSVSVVEDIRDGLRARAKAKEEHA